MILTGHRHNSNQYYIQEKVLSIFCWVSGNDMFIESFESRSPDEWVAVYRTRITRLSHIRDLAVDLASAPRLALASAQG